MSALDDFLGRKPKRATKAYSKKVAHSPRAKGTTTRSKRKKTASKKKAK